MVGCEAKPYQSFDVVLRRALAFDVHDPEIGLGVGVALVGCEAIPLQRLSVVLRHTLAVGIHEPEIKLGVGVALVGKRAPKPKGGCVVAFVICRRSILERPWANGAARFNAKIMGTRPCVSASFKKSVIFGPLSFSSNQ